MSKSIKKPVSKYTGKTIKIGVSEQIKTVGELKEFLKNYPDKLPLAPPTNDEPGILAVWYNVGDNNEHLSLEEAEGSCWTPGEI